MSKLKYYRKKGNTLMRPYVEGEDLESVSVSKDDRPAPGGMIANDPSNPDDKWYISEKFFKENYEEVR